MSLPEKLHRMMPDRGRSDAEALGPVQDHGGSLETARKLFPEAAEPWIDLSTGINAHSYPLFDLPQAAMTRLPEPALPGCLRFGLPADDLAFARLDRALTNWSTGGMSRA